MDKRETEEIARIVDARIRKALHIDGLIGKQMGQMGRLMNSDMKRRINEEMKKHIESKHD